MVQLSSENFFCGHQNIPKHLLTLVLLYRVVAYYIVLHHARKDATVNPMWKKDFSCTFLFCGRVFWVVVWCTLTPGMP
jgi:hypothetical protein